MAETDTGAAHGGTGLGGTTGISPDGNVGVTGTGATNVGGGDMGTPDADAAENPDAVVEDTGAAHDIGNIPGTATPASAEAEEIEVRSPDAGNTPTGGTDAIDADDAVGATGA